MKNLILKIKNYLKSKKINFNFIIILLVVVGLFLTTKLIVDYNIRKKELDIKIKNTQILEDILVKSDLHEKNADSIVNIIEQINKKIDQNEKIDWTDLYTSDPDSIARDVIQWNKSQKR